MNSLEKAILSVLFLITNLIGGYILFLVSYNSNNWVFIVWLWILFIYIAKPYSLIKQDFNETLPKKVIKNSGLYKLDWIIRGLEDVLNADLNDSLPFKMLDASSNEILKITNNILNQHTNISFSPSSLFKNNKLSFFLKSTILSIISYLIILLIVPKNNLVEISGIWLLFFVFLMISEASHKYFLLIKLLRKKITQIKRGYRIGSKELKKYREQKRDLENKIRKLQKRIDTQEQTQIDMVDILIDENIENTLENF